MTTATLPGSIAQPVATAPAQTWRRVARRVRRQPLHAGAVVLLGLIVLLALAGPYVLPLADPNEQHLLDRLAPPLARGEGGALHLAGTDQLGRDVFSRLVHGGRVSIGIAAAAMVLSGVAGTVFGIIAGYRVGWADMAVMRLVDLQMAFPPLLLSVFLLYLLGSGITNLILLLSIFSWAGYTRVARAQTLSLRALPFVEGAVAVGAGEGRILVRHILPHLLPALSVIAVFDFAGVIVAEASLSFLGLGVQPPDSSWGLMLAQGQQFIATGGWWLVAVPAGAIFLTTLSANLSARWAGQLLGSAETKGRL